MTESTQQHEDRFVELVATSWRYHQIFEVAARSDDIAFGSAIASYVNSGWSLIDLESTGTAHLAKFQHGTDRLVIAVTALAENPALAMAVGRLVQVTVGYGQRASSLGHIKDALKAEFKSAMLPSANEPGVITVDGDLSTGYVYANVNLILNLNDYYQGTSEVRPIADDLYTAVVSLHKYLSGRLSA